ncbi:MAG: helix-turn-helix domain-containing protein [Acidovorax sp.]|nr:helix-turn-helix domain-containing protein [Acidovorax sp.]
MRSIEGDRPVIEDLASAFARVRQDVFTPHRHDYYEIFIVRSGSACLQVDLAEFSIDSPSLCLFPPGTVHCWGINSQLRGFVLRVPITALMHETTTGVLPRTQALVYDPHVIQLPENLLSKIDALSHWLYQESLSIGPRDVEILRTQLRLLLLEFARAVRPQVDEPPSIANSMLVERFRQLVEEHYREHWSVPEYAVRLRVGRGRLGRVVQEVLGYTPAQLIHERLIAAATRLVAYSDMPLGRVAEELGFPSQAYFCRVFRKATGLPPSDFRLRAGKDKKRGISDNSVFKVVD